MTVDPQLLDQATDLFTRLGLTLPEAVRLFLTQSVLDEGMPFQSRVPHDEHNIEEDDEEFPLLFSDGVYRFNSIDELYHTLHA